MAEQQMMPMDIQGTMDTIDSNRKKYKHIGKLKDGGASVAIIFRTVPSEPQNCLVIGPKFLDGNYQNTFMKALESAEGQSAFELGHHLAKSRFSDGVEILPFLHKENFIKKMPTENIIVTMGLGTNGEVPLDELNKLIAKQKGISLEELSLLDKPKTVSQPEKTEADAKESKTKSKTKK
jgi:hypothetical protein